MRNSRCLPGAVALFVAFVVGWIGFSAEGWAQSQARVRSAPQRISSEVITSTSLSPEQQQLIDRYAEYWAQQLLTGTNAQISAARSQLMDPLGQNGSQAFVERYAKAVGDRVASAAQSENLIIRLNGMIVATRLRGDAAVAMIQAGLQDPNPAVRYWAAKAVQNVARSGGLDAAQQRALLGGLTVLLQAEGVAPVVEQVMVSIVELDVPAARIEVLAALNGRVAFHAQNPGQPMQAERTGIRELFRKLIEAATTGGGQVNDAVRQIARVAVRYMDLTARQLEAGDLPQERANDYTQVVSLAQSVLKFAHEHLGSAEAMPLNNSGADWSAVRVQVDRWKAILQAPPFGFSAQELATEGNAGAAAGG